LLVLIVYSEPSSSVYIEATVEKSAVGRKQNFTLRIAAGPPPVWLWRHQHNGRRLWTTAFERRTLFTTVDDTSGERRSCSVYNSCGLTPSILLYLKP